MSKPPAPAAAPPPDDDLPPLGEITHLLHQIQSGEEAAKARLIELNYHEIKRRARKELRKSSARNGLRPTEFAHITLERLGLLGPGRANFNNRRHFWKAFAVAMRRVLVDYARTVSAAKRGGKPPLSLEADPVAPMCNPDEVLVVNEALERLSRLDETLFDVLQMQYFVGATVAEIAEKLDLKPRTVSAKLRLARAWLLAELSGNAGLRQ